MPSLVRWHEQLSPEHLSIVGVYSGTAQDPESLESSLRAKQVPYPVLADGRANLERAGALAFPAAFFLDPDGVVLWQGILPRDRSDPGSNRKWIDELLGASGVVPPRAPIRWIRYEKAAEEAESSGQPRLLFVESPGCTQTDDIASLLVEDERVAELASNYITAKIHGRGQVGLVERHGASWPGDLLLLDPAGEVLHRYQETWDLPALKAALERHSGR